MLQNIILNKECIAPKDILTDSALLNDKKILRIIHSTTFTKQQHQLQASERGAVELEALMQKRL